MSNDNIVSLAGHRQAKGIPPYSTVSITPEEGVNGAIFHRVFLAGTKEMSGVAAGGRSAGLCPTWHDALLLTQALQGHYGAMTLLDKSVLAHGNLALLDPPAALVMVSPEDDSFAVVACPHPDLGSWFAPYRTGLSQAEAETLVHVLSIRLNLPILGDDDGGTAA